MSSYIVYSVDLLFAFFQLSCIASKMLCHHATSRAVSNPDPQDPKVGSFANFDSWGSKNPGLLDKRPSKRPEKEPKNKFTGPNFENTESNRGSRVLILRIRYSSNVRA